MLTQHFHSYRKIMILTGAAVVAGFAILHFATSESRATYQVAASHSRPMTNCDAKASKLLKLMEASAPVIQ